jgi:hypothetical protein
MTIQKTILASGLILAVAASANAAQVDPTLKLLTAGAKQGSKASVVVNGIPGQMDGGGVIPITAAAITFKFDTAKAAIAASASDFVPGAGWTRNDFNISGDTVIIGMTNPDGQTAAGPIVTVNATQNSADGSTLTLDPDTNISDDAFNSYYVAGATSALLASPFRQLLAPISGSPSVGPAGNVAVVAGNQLRLLAGADMADVQGFAPATLTAPINGRPAFGNIGGASVVAVGTTDGNVSVFDAATGAPKGAAAKVGNSTTTPAIDSTSGVIYAAAIGAGGATLASVQGDTVTPGVSTIAGATKVYSPAVFGGNVILASDTGVSVLRTAGGAPQASVPDGATAAPILNGAGNGLIVTGGKVYGINATTGALSSTSVAAPAGLADLWFDGGTFYGGAADGKVYKFTIGAGNTPTAAGSDDALAAPINTQVLVLGGTTYALDSAGNFKAGSKAVVNIGGPGTGALAATGRSTSDSIIVSEVGGGIGAMGL